MGMSLIKILVIMIFGVIFSRFVYMASNTKNVHFDQKFKYSRLKTSLAADSSRILIIFTSEVNSTKVELTFDANIIVETVGIYRDTEISCQGDLLLRERFFGKLGVFTVKDVTCSSLDARPGVEIFN